jgi:hypothetical protein
LFLARSSWPGQKRADFFAIFLNRAARSPYPASSASIIRDAASHKIQMQAPIAFQTERLTFTRRGSLPRHYTLQAGCNCQPPGLSELKGHSDKPISHRGVCELFRFEDPGDANSPLLRGKAPTGGEKPSSKLKEIAVAGSSERTPKPNQRSQRQNRQRRDNQRNCRKDNVGMAAPRGGDLDPLHQASGCHFGQMLVLKKRDPATD